MGKTIHQKWLEREDIEELSLQITADTAKDYLNFSKEKIEWLTHKIKL